MSTELTALSGATMGTRYSALFPKRKHIDADRLHGALHAAVTEVDQQMSPWIATSFVNRFNALPLGHWIDMPDETAIVIRTALDIERKSGGAFSIAVAPQVNHFGFGPVPKGRGRAPAMGALARDALCIQGRRVMKVQPIEIDLCGIAKGFGVDRLAEVVMSFGIGDFMVSIDGEVRCQGRPAPGDTWRVALEGPNATHRAAAHIISCENRALATSGSYRQFDLSGPSVTHTIDPRTGCGLLFSESSVTVASERCCDADAWATALLVMGPENADRIASQYGLDFLSMCRAT